MSLTGDWAAILIGVPKGAPTIPAGWTPNPLFAYAGNGATALNYDTLCMAASGPLKARAGSTNMALFCTGEGWGSANFLGTKRLTGANELTSSPAENPLPAIGLASETSGCSGRHGQVYDTYWGLSNYADNTTYPEDASRDWTQFGDIVLPTPSGTTYQLT